MHTISQRITAGSVSSIRTASLLQRFVLWVLQPLMRAQRRWRDGQALASMDARMLRDIGITPNAARREADRLMGPVGRW